MFSSLGVSEAEQLWICPRKYLKNLRQTKCSVCYWKTFHPCLFHIVPWLVVPKATGPYQLGWQVSPGRPSITILSPFPLHLLCRQTFLETSVLTQGVPWRFIPYFRQPWVLFQMSSARLLPSCSSALTSYVKQHWWKRKTCLGKEEVT